MEKYPLEKTPREIYPLEKKAENKHKPKLGKNPQYHTFFLCKMVQLVKSEKFLSKEQINQELICQETSP